MTCDYHTLKECWVGRAYSPDTVEDEFVKQILSETEEDLVDFERILEGHGVTVKRPDYTKVDTTKRPQLLFPRHHLKKINGKLYIGGEEQDIDNWSADVGNLTAQHKIDLAIYCFKEASKELKK